MHSHSQNIALITGTIVIDPHGISGILCHHCNEVISASMVCALPTPCRHRAASPSALMMLLVLVFVQVPHQLILCANHA